MDVIVMPSKKSLLLRSIVNIIVGLIIVAWPAATLVVLVYAFAINILIIGIATLFEPVFNKSSHSNIGAVILGVIGIAAGIYLIARPAVTGEIIALLIAFWAILFGITDLYIGFTSKTKEGGSLLFILAGVISLIFGIYVLNSPLETILSLIFVIGLYSIIVGAVLGCVGLFFYPAAKKSSKA